MLPGLIGLLVICISEALQHGVLLKQLACVRRRSTLQRPIIGIPGQSMDKSIKYLALSDQEMDEGGIKTSKNIEAINREDFPILDQEVYPGKPLVYLDSAASSQKPLFVIDSMNKYYLKTHSTVHRGAHALAAKATTKY